MAAYAEEFFVKIKADISNFQKNMSAVQNSVKQTGEAMKKAGTKMTAGVTLPIVGLGTMALKAGMDFEAGMSEVAAISGATGKDLKKLEKQAMDLGAATRFSASEAASAQGFLAMAGFKTNEIIGAMPGLLDLAASSNMDLARAADIASNIVSGFGMKASDASKVADVLALSAASANTDVEQMGEAMKYAAPVASSLGISIEESAAAIGRMSDAGIQGGSAGRVLRQGLLRLAKPVGEAGDLIEELGISVFDSNGKMKPLDQTIAELEKGLKGMTSQQKTAALATIFGSESVAGWSAMLDVGSENIGAFTKELEKSEGAAKRMADTMMDNTQGALIELKSALESVAIIVSKFVLPHLTQFIKFITEWVRKFSELEESTQKTILVIAGIAAAIGPVILVLGTLLTSLSSLSLLFGPLGIGVSLVIGLFTKLKSEGVSLSSVFDSVKGVVSDISGFFSQMKSTVLDPIIDFLVQNKDQFTSFFNNIIDSVSKVLPIISKIVSSLLNEVFLPLFDFLFKNQNVFSDIFNFFLSAVESTIPVIVSSLNALTDKVIQPLFDLLINNKTAFSDIFDVLLQVIQSVVPIVTTTINGLIENVLGPLLDFFSDKKDVFIGFFWSIGDMVKQSAGVLTQALGSLVENVLLPLFQVIIDNRPIIETFFQTFVNIASAVIPPVINLLSWLVDLFSKIPQPVLEVIAKVGALVAIAIPLIAVFKTIIGVVTTVMGIFSALTPILGVVGSAIAFLLSPIGLVVAAVVGLGVVIFKYWDEIKEFTVNVFSGIADFFTEWGSKVKDFFVNTFNESVATTKERFTAIKYFIVNTFTNVFEFFSNVEEKIKNFFVNTFDDAVATTKERFTAIKDFIVNIFGKIWDFFSGWGEKTDNFFRETFDKVKDFFSNFVTNIKEKITEGFSGIFEKMNTFATDMKDKALEMGKSIISGIVDGIKSMAGGAVDSVKGVASDLLGGFSNVLKINSPSKAFMERAGSIVEGISYGIEDNEEEGVNSIKSLAERLTGAFSPEFAIDDFDLQSSLSNLNGQSSKVQSTFNAQKQQTITLEGDLAPLVTKVKTDVADDVSVITSGRLI